MTETNQSLRLLEALLFASDQPLEEGRLAEKLPDGADVSALLAELAALYVNRGVNLVQLGRKWAFRTSADLAPLLRTEKTVTRRLSRAAVETLAIIAYHQPITRAEIEDVRSVRLSKGTLDLLFETGWVAPKGRRRTPGRPVTWGTTDGFLDHFGLPALGDLPGVDELKAAGLLDPVAPAIPAMADQAVAAAANIEHDAEDEEEEAAPANDHGKADDYDDEAGLAADGLGKPAASEPDDGLIAGARHRTGD